LKKTAVLNTFGKGPGC